jgi:CheY-like chemotaxis protein
MEQITILVVEDDPSHAQLIRAVFATGLPYAQVDVACTGEEARSYLLQRDCPALITLDYSLPDTTGLELLEWLKADDRVADVPVIMFTSSSNPERMNRAYSLGAQRFLEKSTDFGKLATAAREVLGHGGERELDSSA